MKQVLFSIVPLLLLGALFGCASPASVPANQAPAQPTQASTAPPIQATAAPTIPPLPTRIVVTIPPPKISTPLVAPSPEGGTVAVDETLTKLISEAKADLSTRANVPVTAITVKSTEQTEWRDSSLGCPQEGQMYMQMITPGYLIVLEANGQTYNYHASMDHVVWCDK